MQTNNACYCQNFLMLFQRVHAHFVTPYSHQMQAILILTLLSVRHVREIGLYFGRQVFPGQ